VVLVVAAVVVVESRNTVSECKYNDGNLS